MSAVADHLAETKTRQRWSLCFGVAILFHLGVAWLVLQRHPAETLPPPSAAVMIDMAPIPAEQPTPPPKPQPIPKPQVTPSAPKVTAKTVPSPSPKVEVPLPTVPTPNQPVADQTPTLEEKPAPASASPATPQPDTVANAHAASSWQGQLLGRLQQFKRYPPAAQIKRQQGVVQLRFSMNRMGKVLSASIEKSSGYDLLDQEALALIYRAAPLPAPPSEIAGDPVELVVPVQFFLR